MTTESKAPTDAEMMKRHDEFVARQAARWVAVGYLNRMAAKGKTLAQATRTDLRHMVVALGGTTVYSTTRAQMISYIETEMAK